MPWREHSEHATPNVLRKLAADYDRLGLQSTDRVVLERAAKRLVRDIAGFSVLGLSVGAFLSFRIRAAQRLLRAGFGSENSAQFFYANGVGRMGSLTGPSRFYLALGHASSYAFLAGGGCLFGGVNGFLTGTSGVEKILGEDSASRKRIENAFRQLYEEESWRECALEEAGKGNGKV